MSPAATTAPGRRRSSSALPGGASWPAHQMDTSGWNRLADEHGFIVVYPAGRGSPKAWSVDRGAGLARDVRFISELIDTLEAAYNIDPARIYANGLSNGGGMAVRPLLHAVRSDRGGRDGGGGLLTAVELVYGPSTGANDRVSWHRGCACSVPWWPLAGFPGPVCPAEHPNLDGALGAKKPVRTEPHRIRGRCRRHPPRIPELCRRRCRGALHGPGRRARLARRQADAGVAGQVHQQRRGRDEPDVGVLSCASASEEVGSGGLCELDTASLTGSRSGCIIFD